MRQNRQGNWSFRSGCEAKIARIEFRMSILISPPLTLEEFRELYGGRKPYYEYWDGIPVQKAMPTWLHGLVQRILADLLEEAGYKAGIELELRIVDNWQPIPDVVGALAVQEPYPTKPVEIVIEILSPGDLRTKLEEKCQRYADLGVQNIFVIDPEQRSGFEWNPTQNRLEPVVGLLLPNGKLVNLAELWYRLAKKLS
jgi:Uma2 family endonuclease